MRHFLKWVLTSATAFVVVFIGVPVLLAMGIFAAKLAFCMFSDALAWKGI